MKKVVVLLIMVVAVIVIFKLVGSGSLPFGSKTPEMREISRLEGEFRVIRQEYRQGVKIAGMSGQDMTVEAEAAIDEAEGLLSELDVFFGTMKDAEAKKEAETLRMELKKFIQAPR